MLCSKVINEQQHQMIALVVANERNIGECLLFASILANHSAAIFLPVSSLFLTVLFLLLKVPGGGGGGSGAHTIKEWHSSNAP